MTSVRVIQPTNFLFGAPIKYEAGVITLENAVGITEAWMRYLHEFQIFFDRIEIALAANSLDVLQPLTCDDVLTQQYHPEDYSLFKQSKFTWGGSAVGTTTITRLWRRFYKYQPSETTKPFYLCVEGGFKGNNTTTIIDAQSRVNAYVSVNIGTNFDVAIGLLGVTKLANIVAGAGGNNNTSVIPAVTSLSGRMDFYCNGTDILISPYRQPVYIEAATHIQAGKILNFSTPFGVPRPFVLAKAKKYESGNEPIYEPIAITAPIYNGLNVNGVNAHSIGFGSTSSNVGTSMLMTCDGSINLGVRSLLDEADDLSDRVGRIVAEPFTVIRGNGLMYEAGGILRMIDPQRSLMDIYEHDFTVLGGVKTAVVVPCLLSHHSQTYIGLTNLNTSVLGVILDDVIVDG